jgi:hypothetical protein
MLLHANKFDRGLGRLQSTTRNISKNLFCPTDGSLIQPTELQDAMAQSAWSPEI